MAAESTGSDLLAAIEALGWPAIGSSRAGRPIRGRRLGGEGPALVMMGGIHGDEPASVAALLDLIAAPPATRLGLWVVPALNPDGIVAGTKNSAADVDLNRN